MVGFVGSTVDLPPIPKHERQLELARRAQAGDQAAFDEMLVGNLRLVIHWAHRYQGRGVELEDLVQEGTFGLHRAIEKFDPDAGFRFSTYATWWIRQSLRRAIATQGRAIRIPDAVLDAEVAAEQLGEERTLTPRVTASLDASYTEQANVPLSGVVVDETPGPDELVIKLALDDDLATALSRLPAPLPDVVRLRFGLNGAPPMARHAVASLLRISQHKVRGLEREALLILRGDEALQLAG